MKIAVYANLDKPKAPATLAELDRLATEKNIQLYCQQDEHAYLPSATCCSQEELAQDKDFLMTLGGDGTLLAAVGLLNGSNTPVVGVNIGKLGFMTSITEDQIETALDDILSGKYSISERSQAHCVLEKQDSEPAHYRGLNDVVLSWGASARVARIELFVNDEMVTTYTCDGIIISTPTGSTGHSLSAGGPILHPCAPGFVISVICPHTMTARPIVIPDDSKIRLQLAEGSKELVLAIDGKPASEAKSGDAVHISRHKETVRLLHLHDYSYFKVLTNKLNWRGSSIH